jgi:hypothetical protein
MFFAPNIISVYARRTFATIVAVFKARVLANGGTFEGESYLTTTVNSLSAYWASFSIFISATAYKANKVYAINPTTVVSDMAWTRVGTASRVNGSGVIETIATGIPRIDWVFGSPYILCEPSRTNYIFNSEDFTKSTWIKMNGTTIVADNTVAPDGTMTMDKVIAPNNTSAWRGICQSTITVGVSTTFCLSAYVSAAEYTKVHFGDQSNGRINVAFNLTTGALISAAGAGYIASSIILIPNTTIYRVSIIFSTDASIGHVSPIVSGYPNSGASLGLYGVQFVGDGTSGIYLWGLQLEISRGASSYIKTTTNAAVTRVADSGAVYVDSATINQSQGILSFEFYYRGIIPNTSSNTQVIAISNSSGFSGTDFVGLFVNTSGKIHAVVCQNSINRVNNDTGVVPLTGNNKVAISFVSGTTKIYLNGTLIATDNSSYVGAFTSTLDRVILGNNNFSLWIKNIGYNPSATGFTNAELLALTT